MSNAHDATAVGPGVPEGEDETDAVVEGVLVEEAVDVPDELTLGVDVRVNVDDEVVEDDAVAEGVGVPTPLLDAVVLDDPISLLVVETAGVADADDDMVATELPVNEAGGEMLDVAVDGGVPDGDTVPCGVVDTAADHDAVAETGGDTLPPGDPDDDGDAPRDREPVGDLVTDGVLDGVGVFAQSGFAPTRTSQSVVALTGAEDQRTPLLVRMLVE